MMRGKMSCSSFLVSFREVRVFRDFLRALPADERKGFAFPSIPP